MGSALESERAATDRETRMQEKHGIGRETDRDRDREREREREREKVKRGEKGRRDDRGWPVDEQRPRRGWSQREIKKIEGCVLSRRR